MVAEGGVDAFVVVCTVAHDVTCPWPSEETPSKADEVKGGSGLPFPPPGCARSSVRQ